MRLTLDPNSLESYRLFLKVKALPRYRIVGRVAEFPDEYASVLGLSRDVAPAMDYVPLPAQFDYQRDVSALAIRKRKFAVFMRCGRGKCLIMLEFCRHGTACLPGNKCGLIVAPLMVIRQTLEEARKFYGGSLAIEQVRAADLNEWLASGTAKLGITNYEAITEDIRPGRLGLLALDEASLLKSHYGKWGQRLIELGAGLEWKLCLTGTPAPNDRIEYANHAVFLDQFPTVNSFLAKFFVNRGQTDNRWELKAHALQAFYTALSHWSIFVTNPATYGWKDGCDAIPPIHVHIHDVPLTEAQRDLVAGAGGDMFGTPGGITSRAKLSQLAKGRHNGQEVETVKPAFIRDMIAGWPQESTLVWCLYNAEQEALARILPNSHSMDGATPPEERERMIADFQSGRVKTLVSKNKILGFGMNLQIATRQVFSGLVDSYEMFHQCVHRSNRIGSTLPLNVHIPVTPIERPMVETVLVKAGRVDRDTEEQEKLFKGWRVAC